MDDWKILEEAYPVQPELQRMAEAVEECVAEFCDTDAYKAYLQIVSAFPKESFRNTMLIAMQQPDATQLDTQENWEALGRLVEDSASEIRVLVPNVRTDHIDGQLREVGFLPVSVFDVSQTDGQPLPTNESFLMHPNQIADKAGAVMEAVRSISGIPVVIIDPDLMDRYFDHGLEGLFAREPAGLPADLSLPARSESGVILVRGGMPKAVTISTALQELAHSLLPDTVGMHEADPRLLREFAAESVAFIVSERLHLDTTGYAFPYLQSWSTDKTPEILHAVLPQIVSTSEGVISQFEPQISRIMLREMENKLELPNGRFRLYQLANDKLSEAPRIEGQDTVDKNLYELVYEGEIKDYKDMRGHIDPENIYVALRSDQPSGFAGRPPAASDVLMMRNGDGTTETWLFEPHGTTRINDFSERNQQSERTAQKTEVKREAMER